MTTSLRICLATVEDVPAIVALLADDDIGATRERAEDPLPEGCQPPR